MKIDQWIGCMYAVMNTCQELQRVGVDPGELETAYATNEAAVEVLQTKCARSPWRASLLSPDALLAQGSRCGWCGREEGLGCEGVHRYLWRPAFAVRLHE